jgi:DNA-binding transcriptional MerR regulator
MRGKRLGFSIREIREYLELYDIDPTKAQQNKALLKAVKSRIQILEEQRQALEETLTDLRGLERHALDVLRTVEAKKSLRAAGKAANKTE